MGTAAIWTEDTLGLNSGPEPRTLRDYSWEGQGIRVTLHHRLFGTSGKWLVTCALLGIRARPLKAKDVADAQHEALSAVAEELVRLETQVRKALSE